MALPALAVAASSAVTRYAPTVVNSARTLLNKATNGKVKDVGDIAAYVGKNPARMQVVADSLIRSGIAVDDVLPADITQQSQETRLMREAGMRLADSLKDQFNNGTGVDRVIKGQTAEEAVADIIRIKRVRSVLSVYGSAEKYFLCHPNGGVPMADFAYVKSIKAALN